MWYETVQKLYTGNSKSAIPVPFLMGIDPKLLEYLNCFLKFNNDF